jgi:Ala-tRNA(Pro) deacylase
MNMLELCLTHLRKNRILFSHSIHPAAFTARGVAAAEGVPAHDIAKVVVYFGDNDYGMVVLPADSRVDFAEVGRLMGLSYVRLATETELLEMFPECELGAMPPFGDLFDIPVLVDEAIETEGYIAFSAGTHRDVIHMKFADFRALVNPLIARFAVEEPAGMAI